MLVLNFIGAKEAHHCRNAGRDVGEAGENPAKDGCSKRYTVIRPHFAAQGFLFPTIVWFERAVVRVPGSRTQRRLIRAKQHGGVSKAMESGEWWMAGIHVNGDSKVTPPLHVADVETERFGDCADLVIPSVPKI